MPTNDGKRVPPPQSSCASCRAVDDSRMVACDVCDTWYHYDCVGVSQELEDEDWSCGQCVKARTAKSNQKSSHPTALAQTVSEHTPNHSTTQAANKSSEHHNPSAVNPEVLGAHERNSQKRTPNTTRESSGGNLTQVQEMKLKLLEEEHALELRYLEKRRQILMETSTNSFTEGDINSPGLPHCHSSPHRHSLRPHAQEFLPQSSQQTNPLHQSGFEETLLNRSQIAARQAVSRELPYFDGDPEEWPIFLATFETTTKMCGYTPEENAVRLQKCLRGKAKDAVRSQLLYPGNVDNVIATLKMLFGRPEIVIHSLIRKIQALPAPKVDKLGSLIDFAVAVRNMVATVQACELDDYLYNVSLLQELVDRLPPMIKLNWAMYRQAANKHVTLSVFSDWLYTVAEAASTVTIPPAPSSDHKQRRGKKDDGYLNAHRESSPSPERKPADDSRRGACCTCGGPCNEVEKCKKFLGLDHSGRWSVLRDHKLCRRCLKNHRGACKSSSSCGVNGCSFKHHRLLHNPMSKPLTSTSDVKAPSVTLPPKPSNQQTTSEPPQVPDKSEAAPSRGHNCNTHRSSCKSVLFRYVPVVLYGQGTKVNTHAFLDDGSSLMLLEDDLANELNLEGSSHPICLQWTGDTCRYEDSSRRVSIEVSSIRNKGVKFSLSDVHTVKQLKLPSQTLAFDELAEKHRYLKGLPVDSYKNVRPRILIGINNWRVGHVLESREGEEAEPIAAKTRLGWMVFGTCSGDRYPISAHYSCHISCSSSESDDDLHKAVKEFFSLDSLGITKTEKPIISCDDERALSMMRSLTTLEGERYRTGLLWKYDGVKMPNSKGMAMKRLLCLERRMTRDPDLAEALRLKMKEYVEKGYARKLTSEELEQSYERIWYLPVFPVFNPNKPGKLRIVWDAAAEVNGVSLNTFLLKGPDQLTELPSVLYKFREYLVAIGGDIREMFHQVLMIEADQHCLRFLWRTKRNQGEPDVYVLTVMSFGATCSPSCAQFVKNENAERFRQQFPAAVDAIQKAHYVDDMLTSVENEDDAIELAQQVKRIHSCAGFEMRNWVSNSRKVLTAMGEEQVPEKSMDIAPETANEKVLGMWWSPSSDTFTYKVFTQRNEDILLKGKRPTKRELLRTMMSIYDPLGMIAHYLMFLKVLLQDVWRSGVSWDECIADREWEKWQTWLRFLPKLESLQIPRCYRLATTIGSSTNIQLHTFVDASEEGYAAVCYFRFEEHGQVECALIGAKSRVAPLKFLSIPRLELQAAVVGVRLAKSIQQGHSYNIGKRYFWTDARDVLCWLKSDHRRYSPFVAFRISELLESTEFSEWRWVPSRQNVADEATKWKRAPNLDSESRWFKAPEFLWQPEDQWPHSPSLGTTQDKLRPKLLHHGEARKCIVTPADYNEWKKLLHATARALRSSKDTEAAPSTGDDPLMQNELCEAANYLYRQAQEEVYPEEQKLLMNSKLGSSKKILPKKSPLFKLEPFIDDEGVMRLRGRLGACNLIDETQKHPIILPRQHPVTQLVVQQVHEDFHHQCHQTVLNEIRRKFYIPRLRVVYGKFRRNCQECKTLLAKPEPPAMADLPKARLAAFVRPFSYMGIDYFGPMQVTVGRRVEKRWGVLATCLTTRAVHIELAHTLTTASCIMSLRNIMSRRGIPVEIISDRGTNLVGANQELKKALDEVNQNHLMTEFTTEETKWSFNPPASPHMGGSWERLIQSVKKILSQILPTSHLPTDEVLHSTLVEIENIINSRPLTYVAVDDESSPALTPNDFLIGTSNGIKPLVSFDDSGSALRNTWKTSQVLANAFWKKWLTEYLPEITRRSKWFRPARPIQVGDVVIIVDPNMPRNCWPKGRVIFTKVSKDGQVRSATVQTSSGVYERPAVKLAVLDIDADECGPDQDPTTGGAVAHTPGVLATHRLSSCQQ